MNNKIHIFSIAVEEYQDPRIPSVFFAENDAKAFVDAWLALGAQSADCTILLSKTATKTTIESLFKKFLNGIDKDDIVIFFYAGHGTAFDAASHITAHDTQLGDLEATSIPLSSILEQLRASSSNHVMLFIDACKSGLPISIGMRSITSNFSAEEFQKFCEGSEYHVAFSSCKVNESSWSNPRLKHGIWSYALIQALTGNAKKTLYNNDRITSDSLRDYLSIEVPRLLRETRTGSERQTPCIFGNSTREFIVADLSTVFAQRRLAAETALGNFLKNSLLCGEKHDKICRLSGFKKGHNVPTSHTQTTEGFVRKVGKEEIEKFAEDICEKIQSAFGYKRKDINFALNNGYATIKTPDFDVELSLNQKIDDVSMYTLRTEVKNIRRTEVITDDAFSKIFSPCCDKLVIQFSHRIEIESAIDEIEDNPELKKHLTYKMGSSSFSLRVPSLEVVLFVTSQEIAFSLNKVGDVGTLLKSVHNIMTTLGTSSIPFLLPESKT